MYVRKKERRRRNLSRESEWAGRRRKACAYFRQSKPGRSASRNLRGAPACRKPHGRSQRASSANLIYSTVPHLMTRSKEQERNICMPQSAGHSRSSNSLPDVKRHKQMGAINEVPPCYSLALSWPLQRFGWMETNKKDSHIQRQNTFVPVYRLRGLIQ